MINIFFLLWPMAFYYNKKNQIEDKINNNYLSFFHCISTTCLSNVLILYNYDFNFLQNLIYYFSFSYFTNDTIKIIYDGRMKKDWAFIYHHLTCMYMLYNFSYSINITEITNLLFVGELSNVYNYIVYHMIKNNYSHKKVIGVKILQIIWFFYLRVYCLTYLTYYYYAQNSNKLPMGELYADYYGNGSKKALHKKFVNKKEMNNLSIWIAL